MRIVQVQNNSVYWVTPYVSWQEVPPFAPNIILVEAPDEVAEGWGYTDGEFIRPPEPEAPPAEPYQPTNAEVAQTLEDLKADLIIAGVI